MNRLRLLICTLCWLPVSAAMALGPVAGQATLNWWANDFNADLGTGKVNAGAFGGQASVWVDQKWGLAGALYRSDLSGGANDVDYFSLDVKRRLISATQNNFLAAGVGYEQLGLSGGDAHGPRLLLEGRVGLLGALYAYGQTAWMPVFDDTSTRRGLDAFELEGGVGFSPLPLITLSAGWRQFDLNFTDKAAGTGRNTSAGGPVFRAGVKW
jgi:hypothetical protein